MSEQEDREIIGAAVETIVRRLCFIGIAIVTGLALMCSALLVLFG